jgi:hypothetical protein
MCVLPRAATRRSVVLSLLTLPLLTAQILAKLTAHTRQYGLFGASAAQITLLQAYLAHATGQSDSALDLYRAAAFLAASASPSPDDNKGASASIVDLVKAARLGEAGLLIGLGRAADVGKEARALARDVWGGPSTGGVAGTPGGGRSRSKEANVGLRIAGGLVLGVLEDEILRSKWVAPVLLAHRFPVCLSLMPTYRFSVEQAVHEVVPRPRLGLARQLGQAHHSVADGRPLRRASPWQT